MRLDKEFVKIPTHSRAVNVVRAVCGYEFRPYDGLVNTQCINIDGGMLWDMDRRCTKLGLAFNVGTIIIYTVARDEKLRPRLWGGRWTLCWGGYSSPVVVEDGGILYGKEGLGGCVYACLR